MTSKCTDMWQVVSMCAPAAGLTNVQDGPGASLPCSPWGWSRCLATFPQCHPDFLNIPVLVIKLLPFSLTTHPPVHFFGTQHLVFISARPTSSWLGLLCWWGCKPRGKKRFPPPLYYLLLSALWPRCGFILAMAFCFSNSCH